MGRRVQKLPPETLGGGWDEMDARTCVLWLFLEGSKCETSIMCFSLQSHFSWIHTAGGRNPAPSGI